MSKQSPRDYYRVIATAYFNSPRGDVVIQPENLLREIPGR
jgi:hypothetical protein